MENLAPLRNLLSTIQFLFAVSQGACGRNVREATLSSVQKYSRRSDCFSFHIESCIVIMKRSVKVSPVSVRHS